MKIKKFLVTAIATISIAVPISQVSTASASSWTKGIPNFVKSPINKPWLSNKKFGTWTDTKGRKGYNLPVLITDNRVGQALRAMFDNGKPDNDMSVSWALQFRNPYYKKISSNTYLIKNEPSAKVGLQQVKIQKVGNKIKSWNKLKVGPYAYTGLYKKTNLDIYNDANKN